MLVLFKVDDGVKMTGGEADIWSVEQMLLLKSEEKMSFLSMVFFLDGEVEVSSKWETKVLGVQIPLCFRDASYIGTIGETTLNSNFQKYSLIVSQMVKESSETALLVEIASYEELQKGIDIVADARQSTVNSYGTCMLNLKNAKTNIRYNVRFIVVDDKYTLLVGAKAIQAMNLIKIQFENIMVCKKGSKSNADFSSILTLRHICTDGFEGTVGLRCRLDLPAPEYFQQLLEREIEALPGVKTVADDILVYGEGDTFEAANQPFKA
ncbi:unnamed protein product [Mytilus coruscus]|uniref:Uncharacterized protein n=1 Tax=Mytilus coruscus TaxID=42192 RepID=A0A6J8C1U6_MYTCO|nr:unnamed protein product [Mytilus coruscus]